MDEESNIDEEKIKKFLLNLGLIKDESFENEVE